MNIRIQKRLAVTAVLFSLVLAATNVVAKKPIKPPPDPVVEPNHALAINGYERGLDIYAVDVDGSNPVQIVRRASGFGASFGATVWSPDGTRIVWSDPSYFNLQMVNVDGSNRQEILARTEEMMPYIGGQRNLAPSGFDCDGEPANLLYFLGWTADDNIDYYEQLYVLDLDDLAIPPIRLFDGGNQQHSALDVSPDGQFIATWTIYGSEGDWSLSDARLEIRDVCAFDSDPIYSWSAEDLGLLPGELSVHRIDWSVMDILAISGSNRLTRINEIYFLDLVAPLAVKMMGDGTFGADASNRRATWSPDGTLLAFTSDNDVYVLDIDSVDFTQIASFKLNRDIDWRPSWKAEP